MKLVTIFGILLASASFAADPLDSFKFELSCVRYGGFDNFTIMIHANIDFDGKTNTCTAEKGAYISYKLNYDVPFKCEKPTPVTTGKRHPLQTWVLSAVGPADRITKLALIMNHETKTASGFAISEDGQAHTVNCKKW